MTTSFENQNRGEKSGNENNPLPQTPPNNPEKSIPVKQDDDNDFTRPKPGVNEPEKSDPTRIDEPNKNDHTRIDIPVEPGKK